LEVREPCYEGKCTKEGPGKKKNGAEHIVPKKRCTETKKPSRWPRTKARRRRDWHKEQTKFSGWVKARSALKGKIDLIIRQDRARRRKSLRCPG